MFDWRRILVYTHRWLGIAGCLLFILWFASGVVMMYARMPTLTLDEQLARLPLLDLSTATVSPHQAASAAGVSVDRLRIGMHDGQPAYRLFAAGRWTTVSASDGRVLQALTADQALRIAQRFLPEHARTMQYDTFLDDADQWTFSVRALMPMHRVTVGDEADTWLYVSDQTGEPVMKSTSQQRVWGFLGAVLHWIYFTPLRRQAALWNDVIVWSSIAGCILCLSGLTWGLWRYSPRRLFRLKNARTYSPYAGLMWWHHYAGLFFGLVTFTWILSGLLSMTPWDWTPSTAPTRAQREAMQGGSLHMAAMSLDRLRAALEVLNRSFSVKELEVGQLAGEPFAMAYEPGSLAERARWDSPYFSLAAQPKRLLAWLVDATHGPFSRFSDEAIMAAGMAAMPAAAVEEAAWLTAYDSYYYDRHGARPLPVLRIRFADADRTWLYLDPHSGAVVQHLQPRSRLNRWLSRPTQPRLSVSLLPPSAVGHRGDRAQHRRHRVERDDAGAGVSSAAAAPTTNRSSIALSHISALWRGRGGSKDPPLHGVMLASIGSGRKR